MGNKKQDLETNLNMQGSKIAFKVQLILFANGSQMGREV